MKRRVAGRNRRFRGGFTILELLVAVTLLAIICSMIYSALNVSIRFLDKGEKKMLSLAREHGFLSLINRQVRNAWYDPYKVKIIISARTNLLRLVTRSPLLYPRSGLVLVYYRYDPAADKLYYMEKIDYYNADYDDYLPPLEDMVVLLKNSGNVGFSYDIRKSEGVVVSHQRREYEFIPGSP